MWSYGIVLDTDFYPRDKRAGTKHDFSVSYWTMPTSLSYDATTHRRATGWVQQPELTSVTLMHEKITLKTRTYLQSSYTRQAKPVTQWNRVLPEKAIRPKLPKKFAAFYGNRRFIKHIHNSPLPAPILSQIDPVYLSPSNLLKIPKDASDSEASLNIS